VENLLFRNASEQSIAARTTAESIDLIDKLKTAEDFFELLGGVIRAREVAAAHHFTHQQLAVASQEYAFLRLHPANELVIFRIISVGRVKSRNPEVAGQFAQVDIRQKARISECGLLQALVAGNIQSCKHGIDAEMVLIRNQIRKTDCLSTSQDEIYLGVGHAASLDQILDGGGPGEPSFHDSAFVFFRKQMVQISVKPKANNNHAIGFINCM